MEKFESVGEYIAKAFDMREVEPTPNNPNSSRSHVVITLFLKLKNGSVRRLIVCDLAGVENVFACESNTEIIKFSEQYKNSNQYGDKGKEPIKLDRYSYNQENVPGLNVRESSMYNDQQPKLNELLGMHANAINAYNANQGFVAPPSKKNKKEEMVVQLMKIKLKLLKDVVQAFYSKIFIKVNPQQIFGTILNMI